MNRRAWDNMTVTLPGGFTVNVDYDYEPGRYTLEINDPYSLDFRNIMPINCTMLELLDNFKSPSKIARVIEDALLEALPC